MTRESELRQALHALHVEYRRKARPIIDELIKIENAKPLRPIIFTGDAPEVPFPTWNDGG